MMMMMMLMMMMPTIVLISQGDGARWKPLINRTTFLPFLTSWGAVHHDIADDDDDYFDKAIVDENGDVDDEHLILADIILTMMV